MSVFLGTKVFCRIDDRTQETNTHVLGFVDMCTRRFITTEGWDNCILLSTPTVGFSELITPAIDPVQASIEPQPAGKVEVGMRAVHELPTEILCAIFELSASGLSADPISPSPSESQTRTGSVWADFCALPSLKELSLHCIVLSHVCIQWRYIAIDLQALWARLHLGRNAFKNDCDTKQTTSLFLTRSKSLPLSLDITIDDPATTSDFHLHENCIHEVLHDHVRRCHSLRLLSSDLVITEILDVFIDFNLFTSPLDVHHTPLSHLHVVQTATSTDQPTFPSDLSLVAPHLVSLRVQGVQVSAYPHRRLHDVALVDAFLPYQNHFHLFMKDRSGPTITTLVFSELQCIGPGGHHRDLYGMFFTLSLYYTLQELELSNLTDTAVSGLVGILRPSPPLVFSELRRLTLRGLEVSRSTVLVLAVSFPAISEMVLEDVSGANILVYDIWKTGMHHGVWPQLEEILLDGVIVRRRDIVN
ncbi:hypothetical protein BDZ97DRAFT_1925687 [Flammula alnicola]|nr:hypothetical protein BDZ97DRAFT_1925687 [Flammula alnicola]